MRKVIGNFIINTFVCLWFGIVIGAGVAWGFWALTETIF